MELDAMGSHIFGYVQQRVKIRSSQKVILALQR